MCVDSLLVCGQPACVWIACLCVNSLLVCGQPACVLFLPTSSAIVSNASAGALTGHIQSVTDSYFKSKIYVKDPAASTPHTTPSADCLQIM